MNDEKHVSQFYSMFTISSKNITHTCIHITKSPLKNPENSKICKTYLRKFPLFHCNGTTMKYLHFSFKWQFYNSIFTFSHWLVPKLSYNSTEMKQENILIPKCYWIEVNDVVWYIRVYSCKMFFMILIPTLNSIEYAHIHLLVKRPL